MVSELVAVWMAPWAGWVTFANGVLDPSGECGLAHLEALEFGGGIDQAREMVLDEVPELGFAIDRLFHNLRFTSDDVVREPGTRRLRLRRSLGGAEGSVSAELGTRSAEFFLTADFADRADLRRSRIGQA